MRTIPLHLHDTTIRTSRFFLGWAIALISLVGVVHTFDPVNLSVAQVVFLVATVIGVGIAAPSRTP